LNGWENVSFKSKIKVKMNRIENKRKGKKRKEKGASLSTSGESVGKKERKIDLKKYKEKKHCLSELKTQICRNR
jgi:hypothetical protein